MSKLVSNLLQKFICKKLLSGVDSENLLIDIYFEENRKALQFVDIGTKTKCLINEQPHQLKLAQDKLDKFWKDCSEFVFVRYDSSSVSLTFSHTSHKAYSISSPLQNDSDATNAQRWAKCN